MTHLLSPEEVAALIMIALVVDYMSIGPDSVRDRIAFLLALPAIRQGFDGGPIDQWTVQQLVALIDRLKQAAGNSHIAGATSEFIVSLLVVALAIYTIGALAPTKWVKKLGSFAKMQLPTSPQFRLNTKLWLCAAALGIFADLAAGSFGDLLRGLIDFLTNLVAILPGLFKDN